MDRSVIRSINIAEVVKVEDAVGQEDLGDLAAARGLALTVQTTLEDATVQLFSASISAC